MRITPPTTPLAQPGDLVRVRHREWVVLGIPNEGQLALRPLTGSDHQRVVIDQRLEQPPVRPATFALPDDAAFTTQWKASLLAEALRFTLRRGAGPFRAAAQINFTPRTYQLVPLLMALRQEVPRLLIADDVGIGKTLEAGLILRELMDRGEADACAVLCPPHLVEQWVDELREKFGIKAVAVTSSSANKLERGLQQSKSLFDNYPYSVVSLDYIKSDTRRATFLNKCPDFVIVDEAHTCVGTGTRSGVQKRFELLRELSRDETRRLVLLTATPHSGDEEAFSRLLSLLNPEFGNPDRSSQAFRDRLSIHFVQRRRVDLERTGFGGSRPFPIHKRRPDTYKLNAEHKAFHEAVLDYCLERVQEAGSSERKRRLALWGTLAIMRCVGSSPHAALSALNNRAANQDQGQELGDRVFDEDGDDEDATDIAPAVELVEGDSLRRLIKQAETLKEANDPKLIALEKLLLPLLEEGANPVVFCRFLATADYVKGYFEQKLKRKGILVQAVTGRQTPSARRENVEKMGKGTDNGDSPQRLLIATDCLSEGINLQQLFDTVVHYDLSWNPTRHQQREGRVNRFGQAAPLVRSVMMYSTDSAIDMAVLDVILRKADAIREATGVTVPLPDDQRGTLTEALMSAVVLRGRRSTQLTLDMGFSESTLKQAAQLWRDVAEGEKRSQSIFAQNAMHPEIIEGEWRQTESLLGSPADAQAFVAQVMSVFGTAIESRGRVQVAHLDALPEVLRQRMRDRDLDRALRFVREEPAPTGASYLTRAHPLTALLAETVLEASLDAESLPALEIGRVGAWQSAAVTEVTHVLLLRLRYKLEVRGKSARLLMAEEAATLAIGVDGSLRSGADVRQLIAAAASGNLAEPARQRFVERARAQLQTYLQGSVAGYAEERARLLAQNHRDLRATTTRGTVGAPVEVTAVQPADVIGLFVLVPSA